MVVIPQQARDEPCEPVRVCLMQAQALSSGRGRWVFCRRDRRRKAEQQKCPTLIWHELMTGLTVNLQVLSDCIAGDAKPGIMICCQVSPVERIQPGPCHGSARPLSPGGSIIPVPARVLRPSPAAKSCGRCVCAGASESGVAIVSTHRPGQVRFITRPKSRTMRATRQLLPPPK